MSTFDPAQARQLPKHKLNYNLTYQKDIFSNDISTLTGPNGANYYKINYDNGTNINFSYDNLSPTNYTAATVYILGLLHNNITGLTDNNQTNIVGEMVIEYSNTQNTNKVYTCFLLKTNTNSALAGMNNIDNIISMVKNKTPVKLSNIVFNDDIPTQGNAGCFIYNDTNNKNNTVVVFLNPIIINPSTASTLSSALTADSDGNTPLFSVNAPIQQQTTTNISTSSDGPKGDSENIYIDCNPSGESNDTIATYNLPINSGFMNEKNQIDVMKTAVNFFIFTFLAVFVYFTIPNLYKKLIIDGVNIFSKDYPTKVDNPLTRIRSIDVWITLIIGFTCYVLINAGLNNDDYYSLFGGLSLVLVFCLSVALIQSYKMNEQDYMKTILGECGKIGQNYGMEDTAKYNSLSDFLKTISDGLEYYIMSILKYHAAFTIVGAGFYLLSNYITTGNAPSFNQDSLSTLSTIACIMILPAFIIKSYMR